MLNVSITEVTKALKGMTFPAEKDDLVQHAEQNGADDSVLDFLYEMPDGEYDSMTEIMSALGDVHAEEKKEDEEEDE